VKSSAMSPRQPEVPNFIGEAEMLATRTHRIAPECSVDRADDVQGGTRKRQKVRSARIVLVTCGKFGGGAEDGSAVVTKRLAACVNIVSAPVESVYRWKGKIERRKSFC